MTSRGEIVNKMEKLPSSNYPCDDPPREANQETKDEEEEEEYFTIGEELRYAILEYRRKQYEPYKGEYY